MIKILTIFVIATTISLAAYGKVVLTAPPVALIQSAVNNLKAVKMQTKNCSNCGKLKSINDFNKGVRGKYGVRAECKECIVVKHKRFIKTKSGLITSIYSQQRKISKVRTHPMPTYSREQLKNWLFNQSIFHELYNSWELSGFNKNITPSCDRIDDYKGYSFGNIKLMTWKDNRDKSYHDRRCGINNKHSKAVIGIHTMTGEIIEFHSIIEAYRITGISRSGISACCLGVKNNKSAGGFNWKHKNKTS